MPAPRMTPSGQPAMSKTCGSAGASASGEEGIERVAAAASAARLQPIAQSRQRIAALNIGMERLRGKHIICHVSDICHVATLWR
jgi:hypothetical protein